MVWAKAALKARPASATAALAPDSASRPAPVRAWAASMVAPTDSPAGSASSAGIPPVSTPLR